MVICVLKCKKLVITVVSFGADGDSRELKSMQILPIYYFLLPTLWLPCHLQIVQIKFPFLQSGGNGLL